MATKVKLAGASVTFGSPLTARVAEIPDLRGARQFMFNSLEPKVPGCKSNYPAWRGDEKWLIPAATTKVFDTAPEVMVSVPVPFAKTRAKNRSSSCIHRG